MKAAFFINFILLFFLGNIYVFIRLWQALPLNHMGTKILFIALAVLLSCSMFITFIAGNALPLPLSSFLYKIGTGWVITFLYFFMFILLRDIVLLADRFIHFIPVSLSGQALFRPIATGIAVGLASLFLLYGYIHYYHKKRVEITIETEKLMPEASIKIVGVSDLHIGYGIGNRELGKWVKLINAEQPDLILIAGDLIDNNVYPLNKLRMDEELKKLNASMGVYACPGNHEYISHIDASGNFFKKSHIHLLKDSVEEIHDMLYIIGRDDRTNPERKTMQELVNDTDSSKFTILLDHQPYHLKEAEEDRIDLQLSGHTHRGQVWPISIITDRLYELSHGYTRKGNSHFYVSSGLGIWGGKFRIGSQSEYVVINLKGKHP